MDRKKANNGAKPVYEEQNQIESGLALALLSPGLSGPLVSIVGCRTCIESGQINAVRMGMDGEDGG